jgi:hypothetical protein
VPHFKIQAIAFKEGGAWVAQGIEYDIVAHSFDPMTLPQAFMRAVLENILITEHLGRRPLEGIKPAPRRFHDLLDDAITEMTPIKQDPRVDISVRVVERAA